MPIQIKELISSDSLSQAIEKLNFNFDQLILSGGGPPGPIGIAGPVGPNGANGVRGSQWNTSNVSGTSGATFLSTSLANDKVLDIGGTVWNYTGSTWVSTINIKGVKGDTGADGVSADIKRYQGVLNGGEYVATDIATPLNDRNTPDFFGFNDGNKAGVNVHVFGHLEDAVTASNAPGPSEQPTALIMQSNLNAGIYLGLGGEYTSGDAVIGSPDFNKYANIFKGASGFTIDSTRTDSISGSEGDITLNAKGPSGKVFLNAKNQNANISVGDTSGTGTIRIQTEKSNGDINLRLLTGTRDENFTLDEAKINYTTLNGSSLVEQFRITRGGEAAIRNTLKIGDPLTTSPGIHWQYSVKILNGALSMGRGEAVSSNILWDSYWKNEESGAGWRIHMNRPGQGELYESEFKIYVAGDSRTSTGFTPTAAGTDLGSSSTKLLEPIAIRSYDGRIKLQDDNNILEGVTIGKHSMPSNFLTGDIAAGGQQYKTLLIGSGNDSIRPRMALGYDINNYTAIQQVKRNGTTSDAAGAIYGSYDSTVPTTANNFTWGTVSGLPNGVPGYSGSPATKPVVFNFGSGITYTRTKYTTDKVNIAGGIKLTANSPGFDTGTNQYTNIGKHYSDIMFNGDGNDRSTLYLGSKTEDPKDDMNLHTSLGSGSTYAYAPNPYGKLNIYSPSTGIKNGGSAITLWDKRDSMTVSGHTLNPINMYGKIFIEQGSGQSGRSASSTDFGYHGRFVIESSGNFLSSGAVTGIAGGALIDMVIRTTNTSSSIYLDSADEIYLYAAKDILIDSKDDIKLNATGGSSNDIEILADRDIVIKSYGNGTATGGNQGDITIQTSGASSAINLTTTDTIKISGGTTNPGANKILTCTASDGTAKWQTQVATNTSSTMKSTFTSNDAILNYTKATTTTTTTTTVAWVTVGTTTSTSVTSPQPTTYNYLSSSYNFYGGSSVFNNATVNDMPSRTYDRIITMSSQNHPTGGNSAARMFRAAFYLENGPGGNFGKYYISSGAVPYGFEQMAEIEGNLGTMSMYVPAGCKWRCFVVGRRSTGSAQCTVNFKEQRFE